MTKKNIFKRATYAIKYGALGAIGGTLVMATAVPVLGLAAHGLGYASEDVRNNYSLKNRFETAYCFDTPENHKYYYSTPIFNGYTASDQQSKEYYMASPYATYGATAAGTIAGAILLGGAGIALAKRKEKER